MTNNTDFPILPVDENIIGILGGGQLGKMIALSAKEQDTKLIYIVPKAIIPLSQLLVK